MAAVSKLASGVTDWLFRVGDGKNFKNSSKYNIWGINIQKCAGKAFIKRVKYGDRLWFVMAKSKGKILAVATYRSYNAREVGPLLDITMSNKTLGWDGNDTDWDTELHYTDLYVLDKCNMLSNIQGAYSIRRYNEKCEVDLQVEYAHIQRYSKVCCKFNTNTEMYDIHEGSDEITTDATEVANMVFDTPSIMPTSSGAGAACGGGGGETIEGSYGNTKDVEVDNTAHVEKISKKLNSDRLIGRILIHFVENSSLSKEEYLHLRGTDFKSTYKAATSALQITRCPHPWLSRYQKLWGNIVCERDGLLYILPRWKRYIIDASR